MIISVLERDQVDVVGLDRHPVLDQVDRQLGVTGQELVHHAFEVGRQVLDDHERHPGVPRQVVEEALDGSSPPAEAPIPTTCDGLRSCGNSLMSSPRSDSLIQDCKHWSDGVESYNITFAAFCARACVCLLERRRRHPLFSELAGAYASETAPAALGDRAPHNDLVIKNDVCAIAHIKPAPSIIDSRHYIPSLVSDFIATGLSTSTKCPPAAGSRIQRAMKNPHAVALGRLGGAKGGPARAKALSPRRRSQIAKRAAMARARSLSPAERRGMARRAAAARWSNHIRITMALDAPAAVRRLLRGYDLDRLKWRNLDHRYLIVREILLRGDARAIRWLRGALAARQIRDLVRWRGAAGCSEVERQKLRRVLRLDFQDRLVGAESGWAQSDSSARTEVS